MDIATIAGHLAFGLIAFSFLVKDILWLRTISIIASLFSVFYNYFIPVEPMWLAINWNFVFIAVNVYHIAVIIYEKRPVTMDDKNTELYETLFSEMTPVEYLKISKKSKWVTSFCLFFLKSLCKKLRKDGGPTGRLFSDGETLSES